VPPELLSGPHSYSDLDFLSLLKSPNKSGDTRSTHAAIIQGKAGAGKSIFLKYAFLKLQNEIDDRIPILIELRRLNHRRLTNPANPTTEELVDVVHQEIATYSAEVSKAQVEDGLKHGMFILLFDGIDEIRPKIQTLYERLLRELSPKYPDCPIVITGRPMTKLIGWTTFGLYNLAPLSETDGIKLVRNTVAECISRQQFIEVLASGLTDDYKEMSSNPLLLLVMYVTFSENNILSNTQHEYFEDAFYALWTKHDLRKEGFERSTYTALDRPDFLRLLSAFAVYSYMESDYDIGPTRFTRHFDNALKYCGFKVSEDAFRKDMLVSTCLMVEEGRSLKFIHRSFQEYFASCFISKLPHEQFARVIDSIFSRQETDLVLEFLYSHSPLHLERFWILPTMEKVLYETTDLPLPNETAIDVSEFKMFIRSIYELSPTTDELYAASDVAATMTNTEKTFGKIGLTLESMLEQDERNFQQICSAIKNYNGAADAAVELLLGGS
jgi:NACHT domain